MQLGRFLTAARGCRLRVGSGLVRHRVLAIIAAYVIVLSAAATARASARLASPVEIPIYEVRMLAYSFAFLTTAPVWIVLGRS